MKIYLKSIYYGRYSFFTYFVDNEYRMGKRNIFSIGDTMILDDLIPMDIMNAILDTKRLEDISELRIRLNKPIRYALDGAYHTLYEDGEIMPATREHINSIMARATERSMYAYNDQLIRGFITYKGGVRIGIGGEGVETDGKVSAFRHINSLTIRIPHEIKGVARNIIANIGNLRSNVLIISRPGMGKTTFLRDYIRCISDSGVNVLLVDERYEVSVMEGGQVTLSVGANTDIISGISKLNAYEMGIRCMSPEVLATDEIFGNREVLTIEDIIRSGVGVVATMHASDMRDIENSEYKALLRLFQYIVKIDIVDSKRKYELIKL